MRFTKMHGLGNDYLYLFGEAPENAPALSRKYSDRHFGVGSDGMIWISPSESADFQMQIFNADGSEAAMCGNGIRCVGKYLFDHHLTRKTALRIDTKSGIKEILLSVENGVCTGASVEMGRALVSQEQVLEAAGETLRGIPVNIGNPHFVIPTRDAENAPLKKAGSALQSHPLFTGGVNAEWIEKTGEKSARMRVWERGSGITLACGTGASASVAALVSRGVFPADEPVSVRLDGGVLQILVRKDGSVKMTGPAVSVCEGEIEC